MRLGDLVAIAIAKHGFKNDTNRDREALEIHAQRFLQRRQRLEFAFMGAGNCELFESIQRMV
jgi:hypothetical protein